MVRKTRKIKSVSLSVSEKLNLLLRPLPTHPDVNTNDELQFLDLGLIKVNGCNMFFCLLCRTCVPLEAMDTHLLHTKGHTRVSTSKATRQAFDNLGGYDVPMRLPPISARPIPPLPALPDPIPATRCSRCPQDDPYAIWKSDSGKSNHKKKKHPELRLSLTGTRIFVQPLFPKNYGGYNRPLQEVIWNPRMRPKSNSAGTTADSIKQKMLEDILKQMPGPSMSTTMPESTGYADTTPFLRVTGWAELLQGLDPNDLITAVEFPTRGDPFEGLSGACKTLFLAQQDIIKKAYPSILRKWMNDSTAQVIFNTLGKEGTESYVRRLVRFVAFVLRVATGLAITGENDQKLELFLTDQQRENAETVRTNLTCHNRALQTSLQQLLVSCFAPTDTHHLTDNKFKDIVQVFCMLTSIDRTGQFSEPKNITSPLAAMQYIIRSVLLQKGVDDSKSRPADPSQSKPTDPDEIFNKICDRFLCRNRISPYGGLQDLKAKVWTYARTSTSLPNVQWVGSNFDRVSVNGKIIELQDLKLMLDQLRDTANYLLYEELLFGISPERLGFNWKPGDVLVDNLSCRDPGYSVFTEIANEHHFAKAREDLLSIFIDDDRARSFFYDGEIRPGGPPPLLRRDRVRTWLKRWEELQEVTALLMHILGGQPARCSELMKMHVENTPGRFRHLYWLDGHFFFLVCMSKTTGLTHKDRIIPHGLPPELNELLLVSNGLVRPVAAAYTHILYGEKMSEKQRVEFFNAGGEPIITARISARLQSMTQAALDNSLGIAVWRHLCILIMRKYFKLEPGEEQLEDDDVENIYDLQAGHTSRLARNHYAVEPMEWHLMRDDTLAKYMEISDKVSAWYLDFDRDIGATTRQKRPAPQDTGNSDESELSEDESASGSELSDAAEPTGVNVGDEGSSEGESNEGVSDTDNESDAGKAGPSASRRGKPAKSRHDEFVPPRGFAKSRTVQPRTMSTRATKRARHN